ncbi:MAG: GreA/GreB family elongation factor [Patescibacteria group bacterium]
MEKTIQIGSKIRAEINGLNKVIIIVEQQNVDPENGKISEFSPVGAALIGHEQGDQFEARLPSGKYLFNIKRVL